MPRRTPARLEGPGEFPIRGFSAYRVARFFWREEFGSAWVCLEAGVGRPVTMPRDCELGQCGSGLFVCVCFAPIVTRRRSACRSIARATYRTISGNVRVCFNVCVCVFMSVSCERYLATVIILDGVRECVRVCVCVVSSRSRRR